MRFIELSEGQVHLDEQDIAAVELGSLHRQIGLVAQHRLARSLLKNPHILVLDEATSMFDPEGEREFIEGCSEALAEREVEMPPQSIESTQERP